MTNFLTGPEDLCRSENLPFYEKLKKNQNNLDHNDSENGVIEGDEFGVFLLFPLFKNSYSSCSHVWITIDVLIVNVFL